MMLVEPVDLICEPLYAARRVGWFLIVSVELDEAAEQVQHLLRILSPKLEYAHACELRELQRDFEKRFGDAIAGCAPAA